MKQEIIAESFAPPFAARSHFAGSPPEQPHVCVIQHDDRVLVDDGVCHRLLSSPTSAPWACQRGPGSDRPNTCTKKLFALCVCVNQQVARRQQNLTLLTMGTLNATHLSAGFQWPNVTQRLKHLIASTVANTRGTINCNARGASTSQSANVSPVGIKANWNKVSFLHAALSIFPECSVVAFIDSDVALLKTPALLKREWAQLAITSTPIMHVTRELFAFLANPDAVLFSARDAYGYSGALMRNAKPPNDPMLIDLWRVSPETVNLNQTMSNTGVVFVKNGARGRRLLRKWLCWPFMDHRGHAFGEPLSLYLRWWPFEQRVLDELVLQNALPPGAVVHTRHAGDFSSRYIQHYFKKTADNFAQLHGLAGLAGLRPTVLPFQRRQTRTAAAAGPFPYSPEG